MNEREAERMDILQSIYNRMFDGDGQRVISWDPTSISNIVYNHYIYLEQKGLIEISRSSSGWELAVTADGIDTIELKHPLR
ncbi:hypothetical protein [Alicyclobacillus sp. ALC3]|uniref:hypothetical protein n=1 Tax=Alicyclobacillus sp. ALC3 TaxID=2796143 RepID=UPI002377DA23|nr:hypothetical protein [Alicyclobacillus sp. ALC3]WDL98143.1 hypothetical protein JC200_05425 [Alicyclobacillus sp. ALC3]